MEEKKTTTEAQRRAMAKYQKKFVHTAVNFEREKRDRIQAYCKKQGKSFGQIVNEYFDKVLAEEGI